MILKPPRNSISPRNGTYSRRLLIKTLTLFITITILPFTLISCQDDETSSSPTDNTPETPRDAGDSVQPTIASASTIKTLYGVGEDMELDVTFSEEVTVEGSPTLQVNIGGTPVSAAYDSSNDRTGVTHRFHYTLTNSENDPDGIQVDEIILNDGSIRDEAGNDLVNSPDTPITVSGPTEGTTVQVDTAPPTLTGLADDSSPGVTKTWTWSCDDESTCEYQYVANSSSTHSFTDSAYNTDIEYTFTPPGSPLSNSATYYLHIRARDAAGNESSVESFSFIIDNQPPALSSTLTVPADGTYNANDVLNFTVNYSENVIVNTDQGTPYIYLLFAATGDGSASNLRQAQYLSGSGTRNIVFSYTVQSGDTDDDGISINSSIQLNNGTMTDAAGNAAILQGYNAGVLSGVIIDGTTTDFLSSRQSETPSSNRGNIVYWQKHHPPQHFPRSSLADLLPLLKNPNDRAEHAFIVEESRGGPVEEVIVFNRKLKKYEAQRVVEYLEERQNEPGAVLLELKY